jgi:hypothetical protein
MATPPFGRILPSSQQKRHKTGRQRLLNTRHENSLSSSAGPTSKPRSRNSTQAATTTSRLLSIICHSVCIMSFVLSRNMHVAPSTTFFQRCENNRLHPIKQGVRIIRQIDVSLAVFRCLSVYSKCGALQVALLIRYGEVSMWHIRKAHTYGICTHKTLPSHRPMQRLKSMNQMPSTPAQYCLPRSCMRSKRNRSTSSISSCFS